MDWFRKWLENRRDILKGCTEEREKDEILEKTSIQSKSTLRKHLNDSLDSGTISKNDGEYRTTFGGRFAERLLNEILTRVDGLEDLFEEKSQDEMS